MGILTEWGQLLGDPDCPFIKRWMIQTAAGSIRLHHWISGDDDRAMHNHPWWFVTLVLKGGYTDVSMSGRDHLHAGSIRYRAPEHSHIAEPDQGGAWTLVITGPAKHEWGFWFRNRFVSAIHWTLQMGDKPCQEARK